jgi:uncharacterized protein (TIGR02594 family)
MEIAKQELGKKVHELAAKAGFANEMHVALQMEARMRRLEEQIATGLQLSVDRPDAGKQYKLTTKTLRDPTPRLLGKFAAGEARELADRNPEIKKYFDGLKTDPTYDKGKSNAIDSAYAASDYRVHVTPWCAAFVNWCLKSANAPYLNFATARSWLDFGTPVASPVYGCVTVIKPGRETGSTTGHVAFFVRKEGKKIRLLGGNQQEKVENKVVGDWLSEWEFDESKVLPNGYRWPTSVNHYLAIDSPSALA